MGSLPIPYRVVHTIDQSTPVLVDPGLVVFGDIAVHHLHVDNLMSSSRYMYSIREVNVQHQGGTGTAAWMYMYSIREVQVKHQGSTGKASGKYR